MWFPFFFLQMTPPRGQTKEMPQMLGRRKVIFHNLCQRTISYFSGSIAQHKMRSFYTKFFFSFINLYQQQMRSYHWQTILSFFPPKLSTSSSDCSSPPYHSATSKDCHFTLGRFLYPLGKDHGKDTWELHNNYDLIVLIFCFWRVILLCGE